MKGLLAAAVVVTLLVASFLLGVATGFEVAGACGVGAGQPGNRPCHVARPAWQLSGGKAPG